MPGMRHLSMNVLGWLIFLEGIRKKNINSKIEMYTELGHRYWSEYR